MESTNEFDPRADAGAHARFGATPWTDVTLTQQGASTASREALERVCRLYWYPVYAHIRQRGNNPHDAEDLTQEFFELLIQKNFLGAADRRRGRFRSFLLVAVNRFLINAHRRGQAQKRGGGQVTVSIDPQAAESWLESESASDDLTPDQSFDRRWAQRVLEQTLVRLQSDYAGRGKADLFEALREFAGEDTGHRDYADAAARLGQSPGHVAVAVHRLRQRYRELLLAEIATTIANPEHAEAELRHLVSSLQS